ncbi:MAG: helix-turn-helix domain-containing protein [Planctomycetota bacterium]
MSISPPAEAGKRLKRTLLLDAAYKVFAENGFHRTRLEDVARSAGYSKASVYNYFQDKEDLFLQASIAASALVTERLSSELQVDRPAIENVECMLRHILADPGELFDFLQAVTEYHGVLEKPDEAGLGRNSLMSAHVRGLKQMLKPLAEAIEQGQQQGAFQMDVDATVAARYLTGIFRSVKVRWRVDGVCGDVDQEVSQILAFVQSGLGVGRDASGAQSTESQPQE